MIVHTRVIAALVFIQVFFAAALVVVTVALTNNAAKVESQADEIAALRADLAVTRTLLADARTERETLQLRVDALAEALLAAGVDPRVVDALSGRRSASSEAPGETSTSSRGDRTESAQERPGGNPRPSPVNPGPSATPSQGPSTPSVPVPPPMPPLPTPPPPSACGSTTVLVPAALCP